MGLNHLPILLILAILALIMFGPKRLPELGHGLGKAITEFKKGVAEMTSHPDQPLAHDPASTPVSAPASVASEATDRQAGENLPHAG